MSSGVRIRGAVLVAALLVAANVALAMDPPGADGGVLGPRGGGGDRGGPPEEDRVDNEKRPRDDEYGEDDAADDDEPEPKQAKHEHVRPRDPEEVVHVDCQRKCALQPAPEAAGAAQFLELAAQLDATVSAAVPHPVFGAGLLHADCVLGPAVAAGIMRLHRCREHLWRISAGQWVNGQHGLGLMAGLPPALAGPAAGLTVGFVYRDWTYTLDADGRVTNAARVALLPAHIAGGQHGTNGDVRAFVAHIGNAGDDAGHVRAATLGGDHNLLNFVPQNSVLNRGLQCTLEMTVHNLLSPPCSCRAHVSITYTYGTLANPAAIAPPGHYRPTVIRYRVEAPPGGIQCAAACDPQSPFGMGVMFDMRYPNL